MHPLLTPSPPPPPRNHQKTFGFSDVFRGWRKGALGTNGLNIKGKRKFPKCAKLRLLVEI